MELPTGREPKPGRGSLLDVHSNRVTPGRMEEFLSQAADVCAFVESIGAVNARVLQLTHAGKASGTAAFTWEIENWNAQASLGNAWFSDAGMTLRAQSDTTNPPAVPVSSALNSAFPHSPEIRSGRRFTVVPTRRCGTGRRGTSGRIISDHGLLVTVRPLGGHRWSI